MRKKIRDIRGKYKDLIQGMESNRTKAIAIIDEYIRTHALEDVSALEEVKAILKT